MQIVLAVDSQATPAQQVEGEGNILVEIMVEEVIGEEDTIQAATIAILTETIDQMEMGSGQRVVIHEKVQNTQEERWKAPVLEEPSSIHRMSIWSLKAGRNS